MDYIERINLYHERMMSAAASSTAYSWGSAPVPSAPPPSAKKSAFPSEDQARISEMFSQLTATDSQGEGLPQKVTVLHVDADSIHLPEKEERLSFVVEEDLKQAKVTDDGFVLIPKEIKPIDSKSSRVYTVAKVAAKAGEVVITVVSNKTVQDVALIGGSFLFSGPIPGTLLLAGRCVPMLARTWFWGVLPTWAKVALTTAKVVDTHKYWFHGGLVAWTFATQGVFSGSWNALSTFGGRWVSLRLTAIAAAFF